MQGDAMAAIPLAIAGSAAYLYAKTNIGYDVRISSALFGGVVNASLAEKRDRLNPFYLLEEHATSRKSGSRPFIAYEGREWTYKEVYDVALQYGSWLKSKYCIAPGEVIAMDFMNCPEFVFLMMAIWSLGARPAFINYNLTGDPLLHCIQTSTSRIVFVDHEVRSNITSDVAERLASSDFREGSTSVEVVFFDQAIQQEIANTKAVREPDSSRSGVKSHEMAALIYTSGTTGLPKAGIVPWSKGHVGGTFCSRWLGMKKTDRYYTCMPLYHSSAMLLGFFVCLNRGSTLVLGHKFSTKTFWSDVRSQNATIIQYVGETCRYLLAAPPQKDPVTGENLDRKHNVRIAFGNGMRPDVWNRFKERFGIETIGEFYGATEAPAASWNLSSNDYAAGAIGRNGTLASMFLSLRNKIVKVDWATEQPLRSGPNSFCTQVPRGEPGELLMKVDAAEIEKNYQGYYNNKIATESKLMRDVLVKGDAYFRTGDILRWDQEGRWWFVDRIGDTFRWKSENVSTAEVSEALGGHPAVNEANVYGVEIPHHDGRAGCAAVLFEQNVDQKLLDGVAAHVKTRLPKYAVPIFLRVTKQMASTGNNKQQKHLLRSQGVEPGDDKIFWLRNGTYLEMGDKERDELRAGRVKL